ncbi:MAG: hypothetical protein ACK5UM_13225, partial [Pseudomonadota bacterium]
LLAAARAVDTAPVAAAAAAAGARGPAVGAAVRQARERAVAAALATEPGAALPGPAGGGRGATAST